MASCSTKLRGRFKKKKPNVVDKAASLSMRMNRLQVTKFKQKPGKTPTKMVKEERNKSNIIVQNGLLEEPPRYYLPVDLTFGQVEILSRREELYTFVDDLRLIADVMRPRKDADAVTANQNTILVGIDCEYFTDMGFKELATAAVDAVDLTSLWLNFSRVLFLEPLFRKIFFNGEEDLVFLSRLSGFRAPSSTSAAHAKCNITDLYKACRYCLCNNKPHCLGGNVQNLRQRQVNHFLQLSLTDLVRTMLGGAELEKTKKTSGWLHRPLRLMQVVYAALDAPVLVLMHSKLEEICKREAVQFPPLIPKQPLRWLGKSKEESNKAIS